MHTIGTNERASQLPYWTLFLGGLISFSALAGCTRTHYRRQADRQTYQILAEKSADPRWRLPRMNITPDEKSRFYNPSSPDCPPLPPDDPTAHRTMHCAYGMHGWKHWDDFGVTDGVENPIWRQYLDHRVATGETAPDVHRVSVSDAMALGLLDSREYQEQLENVYLSALSLTYQRYRFDIRPRGFLGEPGTELFYEHQPDDQSNLSLGTTHAGFSKLLPTGTQFVAELANNTLWMFGGAGGVGTVTSLGYSIVQPLLRGAGRDVVMESLTQGERNVLYEIRRFARFRKDFYVMVVTGRRAAPLPGSAGGSELAFLIRGERSPTVGFNTLLFLQQLARNQEENVKSLQRRLLDVEAMQQQGEATPLDVTQVRTSLQNARAIYLYRSRRFEDELDRFKLQLGLPPDLDLEIDDSLIEPFRFRDPKLTTLEDQLRSLDSALTEIHQKPSVEAVARVVARLVADQHALATGLQTAARDLDHMRQQLSKRRVLMTPDEVAEFSELEAKYRERLALLTQQHSALDTPLNQLQQRLQAKPVDAKTLSAGVTQVVKLRDTMMRLTRKMGAFITVARGESIVLPEVAAALTPAVAVDLAVEHRLDLMNRRALVMDARRRLEIAADRLKATLNIVAEGDVNTPPLLSNNRPFDFRANDSNFRVGVQLVTPLDRRRQRNDFRAAQVAYERARRNYMAAEDQVKLDVRHELRRVRQETKAFEVQRRALRLAAEELEQALEIPVDRGQTNGGGSQQGLNIPRALENILEAQDLMIEGWMDYERARLSLFRDMGTMTIDSSGAWSSDEQQLWTTGLPPVWCRPTDDRAAQSPAGR